MLSWAWKHRRKLAVATVAAAGTYTAYVVWKKKRELDGIVQELLGATSPGPTREAKVRNHFNVAQAESDRSLLVREMQKDGGLQMQLERLVDTQGFRKRMKEDGKARDRLAFAKLRSLIMTRTVAALQTLALALVVRRILMTIVARHDLLEKDEELVGKAVESGAAACAGTHGLNKISKSRFLSMDVVSEALPSIVDAVGAAVNTRAAEVPAGGQTPTALEGDALREAKTAEEKALASELTAEQAATLLADAADAAAVGVGDALVAVLTSSRDAVAAGDQLQALLGEVCTLARSGMFSIVVTDLVKEACAVAARELSPPSEVVLRPAPPLATPPRPPSCPPPRPPPNALRAA